MLPNPNSLLREKYTLLPCECAEKSLNYLRSQLFKETLSFMFSLARKIEPTWEDAVHVLMIGHVRYIPVSILIWLWGFQEKLLYLVLSSLYLSLFWELKD